MLSNSLLESDKASKFVNPSKAFSSISVILLFSSDNSFKAVTSLKILFDIFFMLLDDKEIHSNFELLSKKFTGIVSILFAWA